jgi:5-methylcytosine-specific restriction endonuclease McrA
MMSETKYKLNPKQVLREDFDKPDSLEMVIVPKNQFLGFKHMKGIVGEMDIKCKDNDWIECPNCKSGMESCSLNNDPSELWYLCTKCNLTFSQRQHQYFTRMMMRLIQGDFKPTESE